MTCSTELVGEGLDMHGGDLGSPVFAENSQACSQQCCDQTSCLGFVFENETDVQTTACNRGSPCCFLKKSWLSTEAKSIASAYRVHRGLGSSGSGESFLEGCVRSEDENGQVRDTFSSGTEDYFLGTYYFNRGKYTNPVAGLTDLDKNQKLFSAYRIHDADPLFFENGLWLTWRNSDPYGVCDLDQANPNAHAVTAASYAFVYEWSTASPMTV